MKKMLVLALFLLPFVLGACYPVQTSGPAFPNGTFVLPNDPGHALQFNNGSFAAILGGTPVAHGTYSAKEGLYSELGNDQGCPIRQYKYTFDGSKLVFHPVQDPATDPCEGRKGDFNESVTWILSR